MDVKGKMKRIGEENEGREEMEYRLEGNEGQGDGGKKRRSRKRNNRKRRRNYWEIVFLRTIG